MTKIDQIQNSILEKMADSLSDEQLQKLENVMAIEFHGIEVQEECTQLVTSELRWQKILNTFLASKRIENCSLGTLDRYGSFEALYGVIGGWIVKDGVMKSNDQKLTLDPANNRIYFNNDDDDHITELSPDGTRTNYLTVDGGIVGGDAALLISAASSSRIQFYDSFSDDGEDMIKLQGNLEVRGTKSRVARTENFSDRLLYCYETPTPMFGDLGRGTTNDRGIAIVDIDPAFSETINSGIEYQVFLQKEGDGDIWIAEKDTEFFMVRGTPNLKFSWEVKCIQKNFEHLRLDEKEVQEAAQKDARDTQKDYNIIIDTVVEDYDKEMEELINESN